MLDSEVPMPKSKAHRDLIELLKENIEGYEAPSDPETLVFEGWKALVDRYAPIFLEKSPHHLLQWSNLELMAEAMKRMPEVDFLIIGLIRNPMDVIYSSWSRWRIFPEVKQYEWKKEYENLLKARELFGENLTFLRYEDMVSEVESLRTIFQFIEAEDHLDTLGEKYLHRKSISKWKQDKLFSFEMAPDVKEVAMRFGYEEELFTNPQKHALWAPYKQTTRIRYKAWVPVRDTLRKIKYAITS